MSNRSTFGCTTDQTLQLRAANGARPVIRMLDWQTDLPDALTVVMGRDSRFTLDGLLLTGRGMRVHGPKKREAGRSTRSDLRRGTGHPALHAGAGLGDGVRLRAVAPGRTKPGAVQHSRHAYASSIASSARSRFMRTSQGRPDSGADHRQHSGRNVGRSGKPSARPVSQWRTRS